MTFIVTVDWHIKPSKAVTFAGLARQQAENSVNLEAECLMFDLAVSRDDPNHFLMYEIYTDAEAFQHHLDAAHFKAFSEQTAGYVLSRTIKTYDKL